MNNYYDKYIKYKSKYLSLKGGMNSDNEEKLQKLIKAFKKNKENELLKELEEEYIIFLKYLI